MIIKIEELREATDWQVPIFVKIGATRVFDDVKLAAKCGADVVVVDGMEGGTAASPEILQDHTGIPTLAAIVEARRGARGRRRATARSSSSPPAASGAASTSPRRSPSGADACYIGTAALIALNCNAPALPRGLRGARHRARAPATTATPAAARSGITTQDPELMARLPIDEAAERVANFLTAMTLEVQMIARACGKANVHDLDPEDLRALTHRGGRDHRHPARRAPHWVPGALDR